MPGFPRIVSILTHELSWSVFRHLFILQNAICALYAFTCYILNSESLSNSTWAKPPCPASWKLFQDSELRELQDPSHLPSFPQGPLFFVVWYPVSTRELFFRYFSWCWGHFRGVRRKGNSPVLFTPSWLEVKDLTHLYLKLAFTLQEDLISASTHLLSDISF